MVFRDSPKSNHGHGPRRVRLLKSFLPPRGPRCFTTRNTLDKNNLKPKVNRVELDYSVVSYKDEAARKDEAPRAAEGQDGATIVAHST